MVDTKIQLAKAMVVKGPSGRDNRYIRGSSIGMCRRRIGYQVLGYQGLPEGAHSAIILDVGNALHDTLQLGLVKLGWVKAKTKLASDGSLDWEQLEGETSGCEIPIIDHERRIIGHCDAVTVPLRKTGRDGLNSYVPDPSGKPYLIEIKSITDKPRFWVLGIRDGGKHRIREEDNPPEFINLAWERTTSGGMSRKLSRFQHSREVSSKYGVKSHPVYKLNTDNGEELITVLMAGNSMGSYGALTEPKSEHILQASLYADYLGIDSIIFIYVGKDVDSNEYENRESLLNLPVKVFEYPVRKEVLSIINEKIVSIYEYVDANTLPPRDYGFTENKSPCGYCPFRWQCYPDNVDLESIKQEMKNLGMPDLVPGPGVMHEPVKSLKKKYGAKAKVK